ncbi:hypothetical protein [Cardinium endosymbiont of Culicoides punctatus]|uniref:hypothetical protein n=1 Tax=Cardinium endosymbiont of Culicoides punctatus TaxID=2304601 RepID=UPI0014045E17|nr:hypothetical protein [Cardinium endosymbiont of Culicoides punctatus]
MKSVIKDRVSFKHSVKSGRGVVELFPQDEKATKEMFMCCDEIIDIIYKNYI